MGYLIALWAVLALSLLLLVVVVAVHGVVGMVRGRRAAPPSAGPVVVRVTLAEVRRDQARAR